MFKYFMLKIKHIANQPFIMQRYYIKNKKRASFYKADTNSITSEKDFLKLICWGIFLS